MSTEVKLILKDTKSKVMNLVAEYKDEKNEFVSHLIAEITIVGHSLKVAKVFDRATFTEYLCTTDKEFNLTV